MVIMMWYVGYAGDANRQVDMESDNDSDSGSGTESRLSSTDSYAMDELLVHHEQQDKHIREKLSENLPPQEQGKAKQS